MRTSIARILLFAAAVQAGPPAFDVASVKVSHAPDAAVQIGGNNTDMRSGRLRVPSAGGTVTMHNWSLGMCILAGFRPILALCRPLRYRRENVTHGDSG